MNTAQQIQSSPATAAGFDLDDLEAVNTSTQTFTVVVKKDEEGNPLAGFHCVGKNSPQYIAVTGEIRVENIQRSAKRQKAIDTSTEGGAQLVAQTIHTNDHKIALAVTVGWFGFAARGKDAEFDKVVMDKLLTKFPTWQQEISAKLESDGNFTTV